MLVKKLGTAFSIYGVYETSLGRSAQWANKAPTRKLGLSSASAGNFCDFFVKTKNSENIKKSKRIYKMRKKAEITKC